MNRLFKRRRKVSVTIVTTWSDILTAHAWGLNLTQWHALTDFERAECRRTVTVAPKFGVGA
jgi:hypothetical protein